MEGEIKESRATDPGVIEYDGELRLTGTSLWLDARRPVMLSFLSNALAFRFQQRLVTSADTVKLLQGKLGSSGALSSPLGRRFSVGELILEMIPAGTVVGSAQLKVVHRGLSLLYCGGVRLEPGWVCEPGLISTADVLVLDCPYDGVDHQFPNRQKTAEALIAWVRSVVEAGENPVIATSELGMAQEVCQLLSSAGVRPRAHRVIADWNRRVRACEIPIQPTPALRKPLTAGEVVVTPPRFVGSEQLRRLVPRPRIAFVSGRASSPEAVTAVGAEVGFCLSCHVDSKTLLGFVRETGASYVYLGPRHSATFEQRLKRTGVGVTRFESQNEQEQLDLFGERADSLDRGSR
jgi:putative mRNA 3-end processing factor